MSAVDVLLAESCVGFGDADELDLGVGGETVEETADVAVDEADDCDADGWGLCDCLVWCEGGGNDRGCEEEFAAKQIFHSLISPKHVGRSRILLAHRRRSGLVRVPVRIHRPASAGVGRPVKESSELAVWG